MAKTTMSDQDDYAELKAEIGSLTLEVGGNHTLEEVEETFERQLKNVTDKAEGMNSNKPDSAYE